jgi:Tfp pilus assembly protein PilV
MYRFQHIHTRQLIALLLLSVMMLVHAVKALHTHTAYNTDHACHQENMIAQAGAIHSACDICDFQLAKDAPFTGEIQLVIAPVNIAPTYSRLLTSINPDRLFVTEGRGPPCA